MRHASLLLVLVACGGDGTIRIADDAAYPADATSSIDAPPPIPSGCIDTTTSGDHTYTCEGLSVDVRIPPACQAPGCGLILELHGDTGSGLLMDGHTKLRDLGALNGYIVLAPTGPLWQGTGPGSTWSSADDAKLVAMVQAFASVFRVDSKKIHVTGFSRGGFVTWRLLCDHSDLFASAAPAGAGYYAGETTCFQNSRAPSRKIPIIFMMGRTDVSVGYSNMVSIRNAAISNYGATGPTVLDSDSNYTHNRWSGADGAVIETFDHAYETVPDGPWASARGHCIAGSTSDPYAAQYAIPCQLPNAFQWGSRVMQFFIDHPMP